MSSGGSIIELPVGCRGFDINRPIDLSLATAMHKQGNRFVGRYIERTAAFRHSYDLTVREIFDIHQAGLGLVVVQHVESASSWTPDAPKGLLYGIGAVEAVKRLGLPQKTPVTLDLEGVAKGIRAVSVIDYCNIWYNEVASAGFTPMLYVGWHCGLSPQQLFHNLSFQHYWGAYNLNADEAPAIRGLQMKQHSATSAAIPPGSGLPVNSIDLDEVLGDKLGGLPLAYVPDEWAA